MLCLFWFDKLRIRILGCIHHDHWRRSLTEIWLKSVGVTMWILCQQKSRTMALEMVLVWFETIWFLQFAIHIAISLLCRMYHHVLCSTCVSACRITLFPATLSWIFNWLNLTYVGMLGQRYGRYIIHYIAWTFGHQPTKTTTVVPWEDHHGKNMSNLNLLFWDVLRRGAPQHGS